MAQNNTMRITVALLTALGIFLAAIVLPKIFVSGVEIPLLTTQGLELILSLLAIGILGRGKFADYGFCLPKAKTRWVLIVLTAPLLGLATSPLILGLGGSGNPMVKHLNPFQIILFVWIFSSVIEEVFTRGFLQGHLSVLSGRYIKVASIRIEMPVLISALFFACMHFVLLIAGVDAVTMIFTFLFTLSIGFMAGHWRAKTGSLIPAIAVHMLANVGGMIGGIVYSIICVLTTGKLPGA